MQNPTEYIESQIETKIELAEDSYVRISQHDFTGEISYIHIHLDNVQKFLDLIKKVSEHK